MTGSSAVVINTAAQAGARAAVGPARVGEPSGFDLLAFSMMLICTGIMFLAVVHLAVRALWSERWW